MGIVRAPECNRSKPDLCKQSECNYWDRHGLHMWRRVKERRKYHSHWQLKNLELAGCNFLLASCFGLASRLRCSSSGWVASLWAEKVFSGPKKGQRTHLRLSGGKRLPLILEQGRYYPRRISPLQGDWWPKVPWECKNTYLRDFQGISGKIKLIQAFRGSTTARDALSLCLRSLKWIKFSKPEVEDISPRENLIRPAFRGRGEERPEMSGS